MPHDYQDVKSVGIQISTDGQRLWLCIDGECVLRVKGIQEPVGILDGRVRSEEAESPWPY